MHQISKVIEQITLVIKQNQLNSLIFLLIIIVYFAGLGGDLFNADQHFWFSRTEGFISALKKGDFINTYQNPKPGVTVMWVSGLSLESFLQLYEAVFKFRPFINTYDTFKYIDFAVKFPIVLLAIVSLVFYFFAIKKIFGKEIAITSLILLAFQPYYIGVNRLFHGDGALNTFMLLSGFSLLYFFHTPRLQVMALSGLFAGLAFLSKSQAVFLIPYIFLSLGIHFLIIRRPILWYFKLLTIWLTVFILSLFIFFPAMWVAPIHILSRIIIEGFYVAEIGRNAGTGSNMGYLYAIPRIFNTLNIVFFVSGVFTVTKHFKSYEPVKKVILLCIFSFIFFYSMQMMLVFQKSSRYLLPVFPFISLIASYGLVQIKVKYRELILLVVSLGLVIYNFPHYLALSETSNWGSVANKAASYLNTKENAVSLRVVVIPKAHTFRPFFKGTTYSEDETIPNNKQADYVVIGYSERLSPEYQHCVFENDIVFRAKTFWTVYRCK
jgi:hypothetical protein